MISVHSEDRSLSLSTLRRCSQDSARGQCRRRADPVPLPDARAGAWDIGITHYDRNYFSKYCEIIFCSIFPLSSCKWGERVHCESSSESDDRTRASGDSITRLRNEIRAVDRTLWSLLSRGRGGGRPRLATRDVSRARLRTRRRYHRCALTPNQTPSPRAERRRELPGRRLLPLRRARRRRRVS